MGEHLCPLWQTQCLRERCAWWTRTSDPERFDEPGLCDCIVVSMWVDQGCIYHDLHRKLRKEDGSNG